MSWIGQLKSSRSNYCALALLALSVFAPSTIAASIVGDRTEMAMLTGQVRQADSNLRSLDYVSCENKQHDTRSFSKRQNALGFTCTLLALFCKCPEINGAGEGNRTLVIITHAAVRQQPGELFSLGIFQNHSPGLSIQLAAHGFGAFVDEALHVMGRAVKGAAHLSGRTMHRFPTHRLFELVQAKRGLSRDGIANDSGNFIDAPVQPIRHIQTREKIFKVRAINAPELLHGHDAFEEPVFPDPRMPDARLY
jgi:hypothetical protein